VANRILYIHPCAPSGFSQSLTEFINRVERANTEIDIVSLSRGPLTLEYRYYEALVLTDILNQVKKAEKEDYDAVIIGCFHNMKLLLSVALLIV